MEPLSISSYAVYILSVNEAYLGKWAHVGIEHLFLALCKVTNFSRADSEMIIQHIGKGKADIDEVQNEFAEVRKVLSAMNIDPNRVRYGLRKELGKGDLVGQDTVLHRTDPCRQVYRKASQLAAGVGATIVNPVHLLWAILEHGDNIATSFLGKEGFDIGQLHRQCEEFITGRRASISDGQKPAVKKEAAKSKTKLLDQIGKDLTALAAEGKLPLIIGRKDEIRQVIRGLLRADKNGVVLIGEPGVGKTCIVEGLAKLIASGRLSDRLAQLKHKRIVEISSSSLLAGTGHRGDFEARMDQLIKECEDNKDTVILFVDEIHTLMGAGKGSGGAIDAGNILKPALSRGRINLVGATTTDEYVRHIESDGAIDRRMIKVYVNEPTRKEALKIIYGLKEQIENQYAIQLEDAAIENAVELSFRYMPERRLPDKAVDIVHQACANKLVSGDLGSFWNDPKSSHVSWSDTGGASVGPDDIATVIAGLCKIPLAKITQSPDEQVDHLQKELSKRIIGQDEALETVCRAIRAAQVGLTEKHRPDGVFFLLGPTGVGKTELAKAVADSLFHQSKDHLIRIDMSEFQEKHQISRLIGAAPGYIGYEQEGTLTGAVRKNPYSVVLFDEVEKAHPDVFDLFLQIFDEGQLTDSHGRRADFSNTLIFLTSNLGARQSKPMGIALVDAKKDLQAEKENFRKGVMKAVQGFMRAELVNRIDHIIFFDYMDVENIKAIAHKIIAAHKDRLFEEHRLELRLTDEAFDYLVAQGYNRQYGVRELKRVIDKSLLQLVTDYIFDHEGVAGKMLVCCLDQEKTLDLREGPAD
jgi:ATP-dependent Clp protease ATP-binding subunit ClpC